jgi:serine/threonine-protein kinase RsbW
MIRFWLWGVFSRIARNAQQGRTPMRELELCLRSDLANLALIFDFVGERARSAGLNEDAVYDVQMAVDEACTNSINHAYKGQTDGSVYVCCTEEPQAFVIRITDYGQPFDPSSVPPPNTSAPLEEREIGGLGLYLMRKLMDEVVFSFDTKLGNRVVMRKYRKDI